MAHTADNKLKIIEHYRSCRSVTATCNTFGVARQTLYNWLKRHGKEGAAGLVAKSRAHRSHPQTTSKETIDHIISLALTHPSLGGTELAKLIEQPYSRVSPQTVNSVLRCEHLSTAAERYLRLEEKYHSCPDRTASDEPGANVIRNANRRYQDFAIRGKQPGEALAFGVLRIDGVGAFKQIIMMSIVDTYSSYVHAALYSSTRVTDAIDLSQEAIRYYARLNCKTACIRIQIQSFKKKSNASKLNAFLNSQEISILSKFSKPTEDYTTRVGFIEHFKCMARDGFFDQWDSRRRPNLDDLQADFATWLGEYNRMALQGYPTMGKSPQMMITEVVNATGSCNLKASQ